ncbi:Phosphatidylinositol 4-kinase pik1alpha (PI4-kinase)(PtdIns-4-kinase) [Coemansia thaxteri]|uniref:1-phosphatidylinositol 4-kinase n=1 Tax=Coemansia thaxteri TaxID=2663907 RepID=A0A9W8BL75_9FUNG|nr:Phosphatidylinositol 4-kinase pik1alpha (PI4-kinase)(PtdIns-4-kinase) [Coemansia thaxteri]
MAQTPESPTPEGTRGSTADVANSQALSADTTATNSSLLLRLFTSQFFDSWLAVSYLFRYPHITGVQHYLCNELRRFPLDEVEFFLPQLVHLLITRPNESTAVESLLLDMSLQSSHVAMLLYWYLQAYLSDLASNPRTASFKHCQRIFNQVQELLFTDIAPELIIDAAAPTQHVFLHAMDNVKSAIASPGRLSSLASRFRTMLRLAPQVRESSHSAIVGISAALASFGAPSLAPTMGWLAIAQGQCIKMSERVGDEHDLLLHQYKPLANKSRISVSGSLDLAKPRAPSSAVHSSFSIDSFSGNPAGPTDFEHCARISSSQPSTPFFGEMENDPVASIASGDNSGASDMSPENNSGAVDMEDDSIDNARSAEVLAASSTPTQRAAASGRPLTPSGCTSIDSCRTASAVECMERPRSMLASTSLVFDSGVGAPSTISRKNYLSKATKQFQRDAKALDRRMCRPIDSVKASAEADNQAATIAAHGAIHSQTCDSSEDRSLAMRMAMDDMATYVERERLKLERRTGYFSAEIKFMTTLMDISRRVCAVSRLGRQQFLKAELTLLNHNLDRHACIPLWCPDSSGLCHHRIVRIPTEDTVVLNSAERAPYLLTLEVLEPTKSDRAESIWSASISGEGVSLAAMATQNTSSNVGGACSELVTPNLLAAPTTATEGTNGSRELQASSWSNPPADSGKTSGIIPETPLAVNSPGVPAAMPAKAAASRPSSLVLSRASGSPMSPTVTTATEGVDEQLMAEVFGDIDDVADIPDTPLSPAAHRGRPSGYSSTNVYPIARDHALSAAKPMSVAAQGSQALDRQSHLADRGSARRPGISTAQLHVSSPDTRAGLPRAVISQEEIQARMRTASVLLAQLARQQKALGIKVANLVVPQPASAADRDGTRAKSEPSDTIRRRGKLGNATSQALAMEEIREKLIREMMQLEELRLKQPGLDSTPGSAAASDGAAQAAGLEATQGDIRFREVEFKDDPSAKVLKEDWESKKARIRRASPYGRHKNWNLLSVIVKEGADLRQEQLALQLIREMQRIWKREQINVFAQYYRIMVTGEGCGLMETITNTVSVHSIKKEFYSRNSGYAGPPYTLYNYFVTSYGTPDTQGFREAQDNFMRSLVSYSLITYVLQIRDRHNGNILLDTAGHVIHIDFGFMLYNSPGSVGFEQAPFKFPMEYVDILGGRDSTKFAEFRQLLVQAFLGLRKHADNICLLVEMMLKSSPLPCLGGGAATVAALRDRFHLALSEQQAEELVESLLLSSCDNITTRMYDAFQYYSNGIL